MNAEKTEVTESVDHQEPEVTESVDPQEPEEQEFFPREHVEKLRRENAKYRERAGRADALARELFTMRVAATGKLADPNDLPYDPTLLDDMAAMEAAVDRLIADHPHYAARVPRGDIGQGATLSGSEVDLAAMLRAHA